MIMTLFKVGLSFSSIFIHEPNFSMVKRVRSHILFEYKDHFLHNQIPFYNSGPDLVYNETTMYVCV